MSRVASRIARANTAGGGNCAKSVSESAGMASNKSFAPTIDSCTSCTRFSGSGSSVIAFTVQDEIGIAEDLQKIFAEEGVQTEALFTSADNNGAGVTRELVPLVERLGAVLHKLEKS